MPLNAGQLLVSQSRKRMRIVVAGRRWGKTHLAMRELCRFAAVPDRLVYYVSPTYGMSKRIMWKPLKKKLLALNWVRKINESDLTIELVNGSEICLKSADNPDTLRGVGLSFCVIDEAADCDREVFYEVLRPALSDKQGHCLIIGTPKGMGWLKDVYDNEKVDPDNWQSFQFRTIDGGNVPQEEVDAARRDLDIRTFQAEYEATFLNYSGIIAYAFGDHNITEVAKPGEREAIMVGCDFNNSPMSAVIARQTREGFEVFDEIVMNSSNTNELVEEVRNRYPLNPITCFPDPAGVQKKTSANGQTDIKILQNAGWTVKFHPRHPQVKDRINTANSLMHLRSDGTTRFKLDPRCKATVKSLQNHVYKENTQIPNKDTNFDHQFDALTYAIEYLYPIRRAVSDEPQPQTWGVY